MFFYYTGAAEPLAPQPIQMASLGGYMSSSRVPNNLLNNLFPDSSSGSQIIAVVLKNELSNATNVSIYAELPEGSTDVYKIAAVSFTNAMERISDNRSLPYVGDFYDITGIANKRVLTASLLTGGMIGLWIQRTVSAAQYPTCDELYNDYKQNGLPDDTKLVQNVKFVIEYS